MFAIRGTRLFDGERFLDDPTVLVDAASVTATGKSGPAPLEVVDAGDDTTILPGLIDCHQHLCFDGNGSLEHQVTGLDDEALRLRARAMARRALIGGVTTLRDVGDRGWITLGLRGDPDLPTILAAGPPITCEHGHCFYLGGECSDDASLLRAVGERVERECDVIKVMATGGALTTGSVPMWEAQFSTHALRIVVDAAHGAGLPVAAHCHGITGIERSLEAGVDSIEHCTFINQEGRAAPSDALLERLASSGVVISATLGRLPQYPLAPFVAANIEVLRSARRRLHSLGATLVAGTDAGINEAKPHDVLPYALGDLVALGMTALEGLRALTTVAAKVCGVGDHKGRLARGYDADIVVVKGDPAANTESLTRVVGVWKSGRRIV